MGVNFDQLSYQAQWQIMAKMANEQRGKVCPAKDNKYHNIPTMREAQAKPIRFASKKEARRYDQLLILERAGQIRDLHLQEDITIKEAFTFPDGTRSRAVRYAADFTYLEPGPEYDQDGNQSGTTWVKVVEDVKSRATVTDKYKIKRKALEEMGIRIREV